VFPDDSKTGVDDDTSGWKYSENEEDDIGLATYVPYMAVPPTLSL
jgi:hypothetical protein